MAGKRLTGELLAQAVHQRIGIAFGDVALLESALTHSSARAGADYQRLEFLGDRVLGLVIADLLYETFPEASEGELSVRLNALVNAETLAEITDELGLSDLILTGSDVRSLAARKQVNMRADVMEALIAVVYLEGGLDAARGFIRAHWTERSKAAGAARSDPKTALQEWAHQVSGATPEYRVEGRDGPDHDPVFTVAVHIGGFTEGRGRGRSKREAEQAAATEVLVREGVWQPLNETSS
ncbi:ribonuclease III [Chelativorans sp. M5D2P16]|uniref:ribonuclease III n=1 Tax=Chelativorans sp. M5D2P16 TaxID=3095678 RepID=UPI002ACA8745|nr:ribonuclease III [Chelativorans sp. M5D2P16]MDZ5696244.1 ribonuclease III [Chelativorans sp. M5D2P16]